MKIGYPTINYSLDCTPNSTFRLKSYSEENLKSKIENNLSCLKKVLEFNVENQLLFFRISSDIVPFASHPVCKFDWRSHYKNEFREIGDYIKKHDIRISMHPDQFIVINPINKEILERSIRELEYHCDILDLMGLDSSAKVQIHMGGVYGNKEESINRFIENYNKLPNNIKKRLVIENDERCYSLKDCLQIYENIKIPIILDTFHHELNNNSEPIKDALKSAAKTWKKKDGKPMIDYSSQKPDAKKGSHTNHINIKIFRRFLEETKGMDFDIMLEIKDKEKSALLAKKYIK